MKIIERWENMCEFLDTFTFVSSLWNESVTQYVVKLVIVASNFSALAAATAITPCSDAKNLLKRINHSAAHCITTIAINSQSHPMMCVRFSFAVGGRFHRWISGVFIQNRAHKSPHLVDRNRLITTTFTCEKSSSNVRTQCGVRYSRNEKSFSSKQCLWLLSFSFLVFQIQCDNIIMYVELVIWFCDKCTYRVVIPKETDWLTE